MKYKNGYIQKQALIEYISDTKSRYTKPIYLKHLSYHQHLAMQ